MSGGGALSPRPGQLVQDACAAVGLAREMAAPLRRRIAPHLPPSQRDHALGLAATLAEGRCCTDEVALALAQLLEDIESAVTAGTALVERPADGRLVAGRDAAIFERRLSPEAEDLRRVAAPLRELLRLVRDVLALAAARREARDLLGT